MLDLLLIQITIFPLNMFVPLKKYQKDYRRFSIFLNLSDCSSAPLKYIWYTLYTFYLFVYAVKTINSKCCSGNSHNVLRKFIKYLTFFPFWDPAALSYHQFHPHCLYLQDSSSKTTFCLNIIAGTLHWCSYFWRDKPLLILSFFMLQVFIFSSLTFPVVSSLIRLLVFLILNFCHFTLIFISWISASNMTSILPLLYTTPPPWLAHP